mmetsp:Transcript_2617/g.8732  ORF Transcript_2617/g.8732 Transcript_2617/m.8732 type:complete len:220 (-) Transcript_2617:1-660(-)
MAQRTSPCTTSLRRTACSLPGSSIPSVWNSQNPLPSATNSLLPFLAAPDAASPLSSSSWSILASFSSSSMEGAALAPSFRGTLLEGPACSSPALLLFVLGWSSSSESSTITSTSSLVACSFLPLGWLYCSKCWGFFLLQSTPYLSEGTVSHDARGRRMGRRMGRRRRRRNLHRSFPGGFQSLLIAVSCPSTALPAYPAPLPSARFSHGGKGRKRAKARE